MAAGTLYSYPENFRAYKILIAAHYSGAKIKVVSESPEFKFGETNKSDIFLKKFPLGKVPAFESDGNYIFESNAIAYYVANDQLRGNSPLDKSHILQWINFADNEILSPTCTWIFPCLGIMQYNKQATQRAKDDIRKLLDVLNNYLLVRTYLVGEYITLADITLACNLLHLYQHVLEPSFRESFVNVNRWFITLIKQPQFKAVIGEVKLCEKMAQFDAKTYAELQSKVKEGGNGFAIEKKEKKKEKKSDKPKEEKEKQEKIVNTEELDLADEVLAAEPKCKDPFEAYPKGTFILDEFKRVYSNEDTLTVAIPYFWKNFDKENYSIWYCEYKYCDELTKIYMSCNLIAGMFQRLEKLRKNAFASMCLFGIDNDSTISGIWIWRGHNLAFELSPDWQVDYESYSFTKLDPDSEDTKKKINEYLAWDGEFGGKQFNQGKIFK